jgi:hypothetical protein
MLGETWVKCLGHRLFATGLLASRARIRTVRSTAANRVLWAVGLLQRPQHGRRRRVGNFDTGPRIICSCVTGAVKQEAGPSSGNAHQAPAEPSLSRGPTPAPPPRTCPVSSACDRTSRQHH